jgi:hypothetical protein
VNNRGVALIELIIGLMITGLIISSATETLSRIYKFYFVVIQQQLKIQDYIFINHLIRQEINEYPFLAFQSNTLYVFSHDKTIQYYVKKNALRRQNGQANGRILSRLLLADNIELKSNPSRLVISLDLMPITIGIQNEPHLSI